MQCSESGECKKKVKVYCKCKKRKEEFRCNQAFNKENLVSCDEDCVKNVKKSVSSDQTSQQDLDEELRKKKEAELFERQLSGAGGRRKRRQRQDNSQQEQTKFNFKSTALMLSGALFFATMAYIVAFY